MSAKQRSHSHSAHFIRLFWFLLPSFGYIGLRFLLNPLRMRVLTEILPKDLYGSLTLATTTIGFVAILSSLGGSEFLIRRLPGSSAPLQHGWLRLILVRLALPGWLLIGAIIGLTKGMGWLPDLSNLDLLLMWVSLGLTSWLAYRVSYAIGCSDILRARGIQVVQTDLWFLAIVMAATWAAASLTHLLWIWTGWLVLTSVGVLLWARLPHEIEKPRENITVVLRYGMPLLPMLVGEILFRLADRYVLLSFYDLKVVADYTLGANISMMVFVTGVSLLDVSGPQLYREGNCRTDKEKHRPTEAMRALFSSMLRHMWGLSLPGGLALAVFHRDIFHILSGPNFRDASGLLPWLAFIPAVYLTVEVMNRALLTSDRPRLVGGSTFFAALLNLGLNLALAPRWGAIGVSVATLFSMAALAITLSFFIRLRAWIFWPELRLPSVVLATVLCGVGFAVLRWGLPNMGPWPRLLLAGLLSGGVLLATRILSPCHVRSGHALTEEAPNPRDPQIAEV